MAKRGNASIRESVDSLYRDGTGEISRDPRTKRLKTGENHSLGLQNTLAIVPIHAPKDLIRTFSRPLENSLIRDFTIFVSSSSSSSSLDPLSPYWNKLKR